MLLISRLPDPRLRHRLLAARHATTICVIVAEAGEQTLAGREMTRPELIGLLPNVPY